MNHVTASLIDQLGMQTPVGYSVFSLQALCIWTRSLTGSRQQEVGPSFISFRDDNVSPCMELISQRC